MLKQKRRGGYNVLICYVHYIQVARHHMRTVTVFKRIKFFKNQNFRELGTRACKREICQLRDEHQLNFSFENKVNFNLMTSMYEAQN